MAGSGAKSTKIHTYMYVYCMGGGIHKVGWMGVLSYGGLLRIKNVEDEVGSLMCFSFSVDFVFFYSFCNFFVMLMSLRSVDARSVATSSVFLVLKGSYDTCVAAEN